MLQAVEAKAGDETSLELENMCKSLFNEWLLDLNFEEKEVWLWNSLVEMKKIKQRRNPQVAENGKTVRYE